MCNDPASIVWTGNHGCPLDLKGSLHQRGAFRALRCRALTHLSSKQRDPNPNENSFIREQCCKSIMESLIR